MRPSTTPAGLAMTDASPPEPRAHAWVQGKHILSPEGEREIWIGRLASFNQSTALAMTARSYGFHRLAGSGSLGASGQQDWHARFRQRDVNPITGVGQEFLGILRVDWDQALWGDPADQILEFRAADMARGVVG